MTDNDKMSEYIRDAHDTARNKAWREEPGTFDTLDAFKAGAAWQAAKSVPDAPDYSVTQLQRLKSLMSELGLSTDESLEVFCLDADRQLSRAITAMHKALSAFKSVPVVGEPVAWFYEDPFSGNYLTSEQISYNDIPLYFAPTTSITEAELERLRKDAERGRLLIDRGEWFRFDHDTPDAYALLAVRLPYSADLSCKPTREDAINAAIAAMEKTISTLPRRTT